MYYVNIQNPEAHGIIVHKIQTGCLNLWFRPKPNTVEILRANSITLSGGCRYWHRLARLQRLLAELPAESYLHLSPRLLYGYWDVGLPGRGEPWLAYPSVCEAARQHSYLVYDGDPICPGTGWTDFLIGPLFPYSDYSPGAAPNQVEEQPAPATTQQGAPQEIAGATTTEEIVRLGEYVSVTAPTALDPLAEAPGHNPDHLSNATCGVGFGWRLLHLGEPVTTSDQRWSGPNSGWLRVRYGAEVFRNEAITCRTWIGAGEQPPDNTRPSTPNVIPNDAHVVGPLPTVMVTNAEGEPVEVQLYLGTRQLKAVKRSPIVVTSEGLPGKHIVVVTKNPFPKRHIYREVEDDDRQFFEIFED